MSIREKLADWLTGGDYGRVQRLLERRSDQYEKQWEALDDIAAMETPSCAPIGKRMAKRAREGRQ